MVSSELSDHKPGILTAFRVLLTFLCVGVIVVLVLYITRSNNTYDADRASKRYENLKKLNEENSQKTSEYAVLDKAKGVYQIPIQQAIILTAKDLAAIPPHAAYPLATPAPVTTPAPPVETPTPSPVATPSASPTSPAPMPAVSPEPSPTPAVKP